LRVQFLVVYFTLLFGSSSGWANGPLVTEPSDWLSTGPHSLQDAFALLSLTESGTKTAEQLRPLVRGGQVALLSTRSKEAEALGLTAADAGLYHHKQIFIDEKSPLIALLATLAHECEHAVEYVVEANGSEKEKALQKGTAESILILMNAEKRGYRAQDLFLSQLIDKFPKAAKAVESAVRHRYLFAYPIRDSELREIFTQAMGISSVQVESFFGPPSDH
jgi:hypothetical protein